MNSLLIITIWFFYTLTLLTGYALGYYSRTPENDKVLKQEGKRVKRILGQITGAKHDAGVVMPMTPDEVAKRRNPQLKEEEEEWDTTVGGQL